VNTDSSYFEGVTGLCYATRSDRLVVTVSTGHSQTANTRSYLWIIPNISNAKRWKAINPGQVIDLTGEDVRFNNRHVQSVCITKETKRFLYLVLTSENNSGGTTLFRMVVEKK
jgi:hypothetical protein